MQGQNLPVKRAEGADPVYPFPIGYARLSDENVKTLPPDCWKTTKYDREPGSAEKIFPEYKSERLSLALLDIALVCEGALEGALR
jgi:hypothetical protein